MVCRRSWNRIGAISAAVTAWANRFSTAHLFHGRPPARKNTRSSTLCPWASQSPNPAASFWLSARGRAQRAGKPPCSWHHARPWEPETSKRGARSYADALAGHRGLGGSRARRTVAGPVDCGRGAVCAGIEWAGAVTTRPGGPGRPGRAVRAAIRPVRRSAAALPRSTSCPACVMSRPASVNTAKRRRLGRAALRAGGRARDLSALRTL